MSKKHVEFDIEPKVVVALSVVASVIAMVVFGLNAGKWIEKAESTHKRADSTHEVVEEIQDPRITALEKKNSDYQTMWDEQIRERQKTIDHAFEVCRAAGECD
jgi:type III secretory pathway component EscR